MKKRVRTWSGLPDKNTRTVWQPEGATIFARTGSRRQFSDTRDDAEGLAPFIIIRTPYIIGSIPCRFLPHHNSPDSGIPHKKTSGLIFVGILVKRGNVFEMAGKNLVEQEEGEKPASPVVECGMNCDGMDCCRNTSLHEHACMEHKFENCCMIWDQCCSACTLITPAAFPSPDQRPRQPSINNQLLSSEFRGSYSSFI